MPGECPGATLKVPKQDQQDEGDIVLKWMSKVLGGSSLDLPAGVPQKWVERLEALLEPLDKLPAGKGRSGLSSDILSWVLHGEPVSILQEAGQLPGVAEQLRITGYHYGDSPKQKLELYDQFESIPADIALRWARLLEASIPSATNCTYLQLPLGRQWPEVILMHSSGNSLTGWSSRRAVADRLSASALEQMLAADGQEPSALLAAAFATPLSSGYGVGQRALVVTDLIGYAESLERHAETIRPLLLSPVVAQRLHIIQMLDKALPQTLAKFAPELCEFGTSSSKQVRAAAEVLIRRSGAACVPALNVIATEGKPEQRVNALRLLWILGQELQDEQVRSFARDTAAADKAPSAQALLADWDATETAAAAEVRYDYTVPQIDWSGSLSPAVETLLDGLWKDANTSIELANKQSRENHERMVAQGHKYRLHQETPFSAADLKSLKTDLAKDGPGTPSQAARSNTAWRHVGSALPKLAGAPGMTPVVMVKMLNFFGLLRDHAGGLTYPSCNTLNALHRAQPQVSLLMLSEMLSPFGLQPMTMLKSYCSAYGGVLARDWADEAVWPFFAHHLELLLQVLSGNTIKDYYFDRHGLFRAIATLPTPPPAAVNALFDLALGPGKNDRLAAQEALANHPGKEVRIINALADGKAEVRTVAAQWLARLRHADAIPALEAAVAREKQDVPKGAMLDALQLFGQPVEKYLDRKALAADAKKAVAKDLPKDLEWFPWSALPIVRWSDSGEPVSSDIIRLLLVQAVKQKTTEPNAVLRKYCGMFEPRDREALGQFVLEGWLAEDTRPVAPEQAHKNAAASAQSIHASVQQYPQYYTDSPYLGRSIAELTALFLPGCLRQPAGSAIGSKGVLALASACARERAAPPVARFLKEYYGTRAAQGKALIAMLAWVEHPSATQLMLSIGNRFRTKSFQEEATRQAEALAERNNWTLAELADRTMPSGGFDESGELQLSYGQRSFTARLLPDFKIELFNPDDKKIAALPDPRQDDDAELAKDAKKAFSAAKKEIKSIVDLQTDRLYEALCTERDWPFEDWDLYLNRHPVVRRLLQRLVWVRVEDGKVIGSFRPLDDGTLTDVEDNEVTLAPADRVRLAHDSLLEGSQVIAWQQHLVDYKVTPLFQQLGKGVYALPAGKAEADSVTDFEGHLIEAFTLRGRSLKLGYTRGAAEDGGWFHVYEKRFPTLGLEAVIEFTGNPLPEENRTVGLLNMSFYNSAEKSWDRPRICLAKVPKILLSECYNDLRLIAAEGSGFDPEWQKKTQY